MTFVLWSCGAKVHKEIQHISISTWPNSVYKQGWLLSSSVVPGLSVEFDYTSTPLHYNKVTFLLSLFFYFLWLWFFTTLLPLLCLTAFLWQKCIADLQASLLKLNLGRNTSLIQRISFSTWTLYCKVPPTNSFVPQNSSHGFWHTR